MKRNIYFSFLIFFSLFLSSCERYRLRSFNGLNSYLVQTSSSNREPDISGRWLAILVNNKGNYKIELIDLLNRKKIILPGLNRIDSQPISVTVNSNGERLAFVRQKSDKTELFLYRRNIGITQKLDIIPKGIPRRISFDSSGKKLAVEVIRNGKWNIDLISLD